MPDIKADSTGEIDDQGRAIKPGAQWKPGTDEEFSDITYEISSGDDSVVAAKITICRPHVRNAFRHDACF